MPDLLQLKVQYFAVLREQRGRSEEAVATTATTPSALYAELRTRHDFALAPELVRAAVNSAFAPMNHPLKSGDIVVFIPPVAGG